MAESKKIDQRRKPVSRKGIGGHPTVLTPELQASVAANRESGSRGKGADD